MKLIFLSKKIELIFFALIISISVHSQEEELSFEIPFSNNPGNNIFISPDTDGLNYSPVVGQESTLY